MDSSTAHIDPDAIKNGPLEKVLSFLRASLEKIKANKITIITVISLISFVTLFFYFNGNRYNNIFYDYQYYTNIAIIVCIALAIVVNIHTFRRASIGADDGEPRLKNIGNTLFYSVLGLGTLIGISIVLYYILRNQDANYFLNFLFALIGGLILLGGAYKLAKHYDLFPTRLVSTMWSKIKPVLFMIPMFLTRGVNAIAQELKITPRYVYVLLLAQLLFVMVYFGLPLLFKYFIHYAYNGQILTDDTYFLDHQRRLANYIDLEGDPSKDTKKYNYNYSIHGWFFAHQKINHYTDDGVFHSIINYGNKPNIEYNPNNNMLRITALKGDNPKPVIVYERNDIELQKWNNIVINYNGSTLDVFLNGIIVHSEPGIVPYYSYDAITIGDDNGMNGGITNVIYFRDVLSKWFIQTNYKLLRNKAIPKY
jgi:hypothetical protein